MHSEMDDDELLAAVLRRDERALATLFARHSPTMLALGRRVLGRVADAEEVLVDVFWEVWRAADRFDGRRGSVRTYLVLLMRSRCLDRLRANAVRSAREAASGTERTGVGQDATPEENAASTERSEAVSEALASLSAEERQAVELAFYRGLTHREIAARLGHPLGTVKSRLRTALIKLGRRLAPPEGTDR